MRRPAGTSAEARASSSRTNKRKANRARKRVLVRFGVGQATHTGFTKNLSERGLFVHTNTVFAPGTTILVEVETPGRSWSFWARVAWAKKVPAQLAHLLECGMGLELIEPGRDWEEFARSWTRTSG
jgi:Tfp pilus assembly protein PilZ